MMTLAEFGLYNWLLDYAWHNDTKPCFLENDARKLSRLVGVPLTVYLKAWAGIQKKFELWINPQTQVEYFFNRRMYAEYSKRLAASNEQSRKGKLRAAEMWKDHVKKDSQDDSRNIAMAIAEGIAPNSLQSREPPKVPRTGDGAEVGDLPEYSPDFEEFFWQHYPKKIGKGKAYEVWRKLRPSNGLRERIQAAVVMAAGSLKWQEDSGRYIPNPARFLREKRWDDGQQQKPNRPEITF